MVELRAELLHADVASRVVRVSAHEGERLLGSCLGEAPDAEQAEDRAVARLRARLGAPMGLAAQSQAGAALERIDQGGAAGAPSATERAPSARGPGPGPAPGEGVASPPAQHGAASTVGASGAAASPAIPSAAPLRPPTARAVREGAAQVPPAESTANAAGSPAGQPSAPSSGGLPAQVEIFASGSASASGTGSGSTSGSASPETSPASQRSPQASPARTSGPEANLAGSHPPQSDPSPARSHPPHGGSPSPSASEPARPEAELNQGSAPEAPPPDPDDWSQELAGLELQLRRLGWGREQEAVFLARAFGHPSRSRLTTYGDLMNYLRALEGLEAGADPSSAAVPLRRRDLVHVGDELLASLGWSAEQGRRFLEEHLGQSSRQRLSDSELLRFNMLLEGELIQLEPTAADALSSPA